MTDYDSMPDDELRADLLHHLCRYVDRHQRQHGHPPAAVTIGRGDWIALGRPLVAAGVRVLPTDDTGAPVPRMAGIQGLQ